MIKKVLILTISLFLVSSNVHSSEETIEINNDSLYSKEKLEKEYKKSIKNNNYIRASSIFQKILKTNPSDENRFLYAELLYKANKLDDSYNEYKEIYNKTKNIYYKNSSLERMRHINFIRNEKKNNLNKEKQVLLIKNEPKVHYLCNPYSPSITENGNIYRWNKSDFPLKVYIPKPDISLNLVDEPSDYVNYVIESFKNWEIASNGLVKFDIIDSQEKASIIVNWKNYFEDEAWGKAQFPHYDNEFKRKISFLYLAVRAQPGTAIYTKNEVLFSKKELIEIITHEIGHTLGLSHSYAYVGNEDIMVPYMYSKMPNYVAKITSRDIKSLYNLYMLPENMLYKCVD